MYYEESDCRAPIMPPTARKKAAPLLLFFVFAGLTHAQNFSIDWFTIDGGGGTSTGGQYALTGTIGQPDAGKLTGGSYVLEGGFWGGAFAIQTPGAPTLHIARSGTNVIISWSPNTAGFVLQESPSVAVPAWMLSGSGAQNPAPPIPATSQTRFYRLRKP